MKRYIYGLSFMLFAWSACTVSKNIGTPNAALPGTFRNAATSDSTGIATIPVKDFFADPVLQSLIDSAINRNYDMQEAVKNIEASQLLFKQTKWNNVPQVDFNLAATTDRPSNTSLNGLSLSEYNIGSSFINDYTANVSLSWEADIWGKIRNKSKAALAQYLQTIEAKKAVQTSLVAEVSQGYYNLLMLDQQLEIARSNVKLNDSTLRIIRLQYDAGQVTLLGVQQAQAQQQAAAELVPQFEQNIAIQEDALSILAGRLPAAILRNKTLEEYELPANLSAGLPSSLLTNRPDVKSAELALNIADANVGINKAAMYPALRITASGGTDSYKASDWFTIPSSLFGIAAASIAQPLLDNKELSTQYHVSLVQRDKAVLQFRQTVLNAVGEVSDALVKIEKLKQQQQIAAERVATLNQATANAGLLFKNGMATYLEVITAQSNVLQSQLELASVKRDELSAVAELYQSLGGGWR